MELHENGNEPSLAPKTSAEFLNLYLNGYTCEEIRNLNPGFKLGIIVKARIEHEWDKHKKEYIDTLMTQTRESVQKIQLEAIRFASDGMSVHQRVLGSAFKKYMQTGNEEDLGTHKDQINIRNYKEYVALLMQLTGQDGKKQVSGEINHNVNVSDPAKVVDAAAVDGASLLQMLDKK